MTSRLHCYLPVRSLGVPVDFQPKNRSDPRFAGLIDITDTEFERIRTGIDDRLEQVLGAALAGRPPDEVYALWRSLCAEDVAAAERRRAADHPLPAARADLLSEVAAVRSALPAVQPGAVPVVVAVPPGGLEAVRVVLASVAAGTTAPVQFWLLTRKPDELDRTGLAAAASGHRVDVVETRRLGMDLRAAGRVPAPRDVDLLVLPELLPGLDRVLVLPVDAVVTGDVAELAATDLDGRLVAAVDPAGQPRASGFGVLNQAANRLGPKTVAATELRRRAYARHRFDFDAFSTDVLVVDAAAWRERGLVTNSVPLIEEFGLTLREVLHFELGPDRATLSARWHLVPGRSPITDPALIHWSEASKPWSEDMVPERDRWRVIARRLAEAGDGVRACRPLSRERGDHGTGPVPY